MTPYIGITGFMYEYEVSEMLKLMPYNSQTRLKVGWCYSGLGLMEERLKPHKDYADIRETFKDHPLVLNIADYSPGICGTAYEAENVIEVCGPNLHGFQIHNLYPWPEIFDLKIIKERFPDKIIILPIGIIAFEMTDFSAKKLAAKIAEYRGLIDYVFIDNRVFDKLDRIVSFIDPDKYIEYIEVVKNAVPEIGITATNRSKLKDFDQYLESLIKVDPNISIDAEIWFRNSAYGIAERNDPDDFFDPNKAKNYLSQVLDIFSNRERRR